MILLKDNIEIYLLCPRDTHKNKGINIIYNDADKLLYI
jgi:hypothetical protein